MGRGGVAVVTGAASGIGFALCEVLGSEGHALVLADRDGEALETALGKLRAAEVDAVGVVTDVTDQDSVDHLADVAAGLGPVTRLCLNAGVARPGAPTWEWDEAAFRFVLDVNLWGLYRCIRAFLPAMVSDGRPAHVVITASMAGLVGTGESSGYAASKAGAVAIAKALRVELAVAAPAVGVTVLVPGMVKTNLMRNSAKQDPAPGRSDLTEAGHQALNDYGITPSEVARGVLAAIRDRRFWALPPAGDPYLGELAEELEQLLRAAKKA